MCMDLNKTGGAQSFCRWIDGHGARKTARLTNKHNFNLCSTTKEKCIAQTDLRKEAFAIPKGMEVGEDWR